MILGAAYHTWFCSYNMEGMLLEPKTTAFEKRLTLITIFFVVTFVGTTGLWILDILGIAKNI
jgi:hypothetical protein